MKDKKETDISEYNSFEHLFTEAAKHIEAIRSVLTPKNSHIVYVQFNVAFNTWLIEKCNWDGKRETYNYFLKKSFFLKFMQFRNEQEREVKEAVKKEQESWAINSLEFADAAKENPSPKLTHRHYAIADSLKFASGELVRLPTRVEMREAGGKKREQAYDSINSASSTYKPITYKELKIVIDVLVNFPKAKQAALKQLSTLEKS